MATKTATRKPVHRKPVKTPVQRKSPGFWSGLRHATHTDRLKHRIGSAAGRRLVTSINRRRARKSLSQIPVRGGWFNPEGAAPAPKARASKSAPKASVPTVHTDKNIAFSGPRVKVMSGPLGAVPVKFGSISVTSSGLAGPGNRAAGAGVGVPAYGTGGQHGDDGHMVSPGSAVGSSVPAGRRKSSRGPSTSGPAGGRQSGNGWPDAGTSTAAPPATPAGPGPVVESSKTTTGSRTMSMSGLDQLAEVPQTDAEYLLALHQLMLDASAYAERIEEIQSGLLEALGIDSAALGAYTVMAEHAAGLAEACKQAARDFAQVYEGVLETARSGVKIPGGPGKFFTGEEVA